MVDPVAEHVQVLVGPVDGGDLGGGHHAHAVQRAGGERLVDAVDGVVVGQRQQLDARAAAFSTTWAAGNSPSECSEWD